MRPLCLMHVGIVSLYFNIIVFRERALVGDLVIMLLRLWQFRMWSAVVIMCYINDVLKLF